VGIHKVTDVTDDVRDERARSAARVKTGGEATIASYEALSSTYK
jgi:hypothetical protein